MTPTLYTDPRLVALYDTLNPFAADTAFYLALAAGKKRVVDIGCGTGLLACELAKRGHDVTAIEPSKEMLRVARARPDGDRVHWIEGDARALALLPSADLVMMTGHVAQVFTDDDAFLDTLRAARHALRGGGQLAFESRNPATRPWESWTPERSRRTIDVAGTGRVAVWLDGVSGGPETTIRFDTHYAFASTDEVRVSTSELRFRTQEALERLLARAGFNRLDWRGDWAGGAVLAESAELIVIAQ